MEPEASLPRSQQLAIFPRLQPYVVTTRPPFYLFRNIHFNIVFASATSKRSASAFPTTTVRMSLLYHACHMCRPPYDLARSTDHEAARYVVFSSHLLSLPPSLRYNCFPHLLTLHS